MTDTSQNTAKAPDYRLTRCACYLGYITQAVGNNFAPLLFVAFHDQLGIPLSRITLLVTLNFTVQLIADIVSAKLPNLIGVRASRSFRSYSIRMRDCSSPSCSMPPEAECSKR